MTATFQPPSVMRAIVQAEPQTLGVRIAAAAVGPAGSIVTVWDGPRPSHQARPTGAETVLDDDRMWLHLDEDTARAIYEGLSSYFGGVGADVRSLRSDYDDERKRVDRLIGHLIGDAR